MNVKTLVFILGMMLPGRLLSFVVLSGPDEATLTQSSDQATVRFHWNGSAPGIKDVEELENGRFLGMTDAGVMEQIILLAFQKWNEVPGSYLRLELETNPASGLDSSDMQHSIVVEKADNLTTAAFALPMTEEDQITDCDISVSSRSTSAKSLAVLSTTDRS